VPKYIYHIKSPHKGLFKIASFQQSYKFHAAFSSAPRSTPPPVPPPPLPSPTPAPEPPHPWRNYSRAAHKAKASAVEAPPPPPLPSPLPSPHTPGPQTATTLLPSSHAHELHCQMRPVPPSNSVASEGPAMPLPPPLSSLSVSLSLSPGRLHWSDAGRVRGRGQSLG